jgi:hypothetical protein
LGEIGERRFFFDGLGSVRAVDFTLLGGGSNRDRSGRRHGELVEERAQGEMNGGLDL